MNTMPGMSTSAPQPLFVTANGVKVYGTPAAMGRAGWVLREMLADVVEMKPKPTGEYRRPKKPTPSPSPVRADFIREP